MPQVPRELIRQVQICTRSAAGLPDYNPSDPTLPSLPPLSAEIAASDHRLRCRNCKGTLLRGSESIVCVYCGVGPHYDVVPDPISFTSTIGYQWLLRSLRLDGSEMVDPTNKSEQNQGYNSPRALTRLSDFLSFTIPWPAEIEKQPEQSEGSLRLTGVAPDKFFLKSKKNAFSDMSNEQAFTQNHIETADGKDNQNLFQNIQSSELAGSSSKRKSSETFSGWEADFQSADSENQHEFPSSSADSKDNLKDHKSFDLSTGLGVNLAAHIDSVFGPGKDLNDGKAEDKDNPAVSRAFDDWNTDDVWNNLGSNNTSHFSGGFDNTLSTKNEREVDHTLLYSKDSSDDLFQDFQSQTRYTDKSENKTTNDDHTLLYSKDSSADLFQDFQSQTSYTDNSENKTTNEDHTLVYSKDSSADLFQDFQSQTNCTDKAESKPTNEEQKTMDEDLFEEWNDFTGSTSIQFPSQNAWTGGDHHVSTSDQKSPEMDLFSFDNKSEKGDFGSFSQPDIFSTSTSNSNATTEINAIISENPASDWLFDVSGPSDESGKAANDGDASGKSAEDEVKMLISQMHDLSFMLETNLCIPSGSDAQNSTKD